MHRPNTANYAFTFLCFVKVSRQNNLNYKNLFSLKYMKLGSCRHVAEKNCMKFNPRNPAAAAGGQLQPGQDIKFKRLEKQVLYYMRSLIFMNRGSIN